jgi:hypothetical protein
MGQKYVNFQSQQRVRPKAKMKSSDFCFLAFLAIVALNTPILNLKVS